MRAGGGPSSPTYLIIIMSSPKCSSTAVVGLKETDSRSQLLVAAMPYSQDFCLFPCLGGMGEVWQEVEDPLVQPSGGWRRAIYFQLLKDFSPDLELIFYP